MNKIQMPATLESGLFPGEGMRTVSWLYWATGEKRAPRVFEYFLSGNPVTAYQAHTDQMTTEYWIAERAHLKTCPACDGRGEVAV